jgi:hypothetical protein
MPRLLIILASSAAGVAASTAVVALAMPDVAHPPGVPFESTPEEDRVIFEACVVFYGITYAVGRWLYRRLGMPEEMKEVADTAGLHMPFLHVLAAVMLLGVTAPVVWRGRGRSGDWLALSLGLVLLPIGLRSLFETLRRYRPFGINFGSPRRDRPV